MTPSSIITITSCLVSTSHTGCNDQLNADLLCIPHRWISSHIDECFQLYRTELQSPNTSVLTIVSVLKDFIIVSDKVISFFFFLIGGIFNKQNKCLKAILFQNYLSVLIVEGDFCSSNPFFIFIIKTIHTDPQCKNLKRNALTRTPTKTHTRLEYY